MAKTIDTSGLDTLQNQVVREPVTATGIALLQLIKDAPGGYLALTQSEGAAIVQAGQATLDPNVAVEDGLAAVRLTQAGELALAVTPAKAKRAPVVVTSGVRTNIPAPLKGKGGKHGSKYPFDTMEIGASFHVPATLENPQPLASIQSSITMARAKFAQLLTNEDGSPKMESVTVKDYQKDESGKIVKDAEGHRVVLSSRQEQQQASKVTRDFVSAAVGADDPDGVGARVWRIV